MAHFHIKKKKGRPYLYVREIVRIDGKPKVVSQVYIGSPEKVADWTTAEIVSVYLDRWIVENGFYQSKNEDIVATRPVRHWTDRMIQCHLFTCVVAMTYLRRLELKLARAGLQLTAENVMFHMRRLHSVLILNKDSRQPIRRLKTPSKTQSEVLSAFGHYIDNNGVLQPISI